MKYLPKSKLGAIVAGLYLIVTCYFVFGFAFGGGGPHGEAGTSSIYAFLLTLPLSGIFGSIATALKGESDTLTGLIIVGGLFFFLLYLMPSPSIL